MYFNFNKIANETGLKFESELECINRMIDIAEYLSTHNKNYTKAQYQKICDLLEIVKNLEIC